MAIAMMGIPVPARLFLVDVRRRPGLLRVMMMNMEDLLDMTFDRAHLVPGVWMMRLGALDHGAFVSYWLHLFWMIAFEVLEKVQTLSVISRRSLDLELGVDQEDVPNGELRGAYKSAAFCAPI